jgi:hypothetical protein
VVDADGRLGARNDVTCVSIEHKMGIHASPTCVLAYGEKEGAVGFLVGEENRGLEYMFTMMNHARLGVGVEGVGLAERAYQHAREYARTRVQGRAIGQASGDRVTIIQHPDVRRMLLTMKAQIEAMRALAYVAAAALDTSRRHPDPLERRRSQGRLDLLTPIVKGWCTEQAVEVASIGVQVHGGMGFIEEAGAAQYLRDARITTIYEGTTGIQANDLVGRKVGYEKGATALALIAEMRETDQALARMGAPFEGSRRHFAAAIDALEAATRWLVDTFPREPQRAAAVAVPYLELFGTVAGGWLMMKSAAIAHAKAGGAGDRDYLASKMVTARFYAEHILPRARAYADTVLTGSSAVLELDPEQF